MNENIYCSSCGELTTSTKFCQSCGSFLGKEDIKVAQPIYQPILQQPQVIVVQQPQLPTNSAADAALIFAILSFCVPFVCSLMAMIFGFFGAFNPHKRDKAILALIIGFLTSGIPALIWILIVFR